MTTETVRETIKRNVIDLAQILEIDVDLSKNTADLLRIHDELSQRVARLLAE